MTRLMWAGLIGMTVAAAGAYRTNVWAEGDSESFKHYEAIINELKASAEEDARPEREREDFATDWNDLTWQGSLAIAGTYVTLAVPELGVRSSGLLKGFEAQAGFHLGSRFARAEVAFRNFAQDPLSNDVMAQMRELEGRVVFTPGLRDGVNMRMGMGASGRYMSVRAARGYTSVDASALTPFYSLIVGVERKIANTITVGPDISYHASLDGASFDKSSWDASFRLNAAF